MTIKAEPGTSYCEIMDPSDTSATRIERVASPVIKIEPTETPIKINTDILLEFVNQRPKAELNDGQEVDMYLLDQLERWYYPLLPVNSMFDDMLIPDLASIFRNPLSTRNGGSTSSIEEDF